MADYDNVHLQNTNLASSANRGHRYKLTKNFTRTRFGQNRFSNRVVNDWNGLSDSLMASASINAFKSGLNKEWRVKENKFGV